MTKGTYEELFSMRTRLLEQISAIDTLLGIKMTNEKLEEKGVKVEKPKPASLKHPNKPRKRK